jgi:hypothetical protein
MAFLRGLEKAPTFLVPIINPPFADNSPHFSATSDEIQRISAGGRPPPISIWKATARRGIPVKRC